MEKWTVINQGIIPKGNYITDLRYGEDHGLLITLKNDIFCITLDFGAVVSVHCIDEGGMLFPPFAHDPYSLYRKDRFKEILYKIAALIPLSPLKPGFIIGIKLVSLL